MQQREAEPGCSNDAQEPSNTDTSTACVQQYDSPRDATSFGNSLLNDHESDNSYPAQVPYPHNMLVRPSYWSSALWRCADDWPTCCITCLCPCITFGQIAKIADGRSSCCVYSIIYLLLSLICAQCLYSFVNRTKFRAKYSLPEQPFSDCCIHCYCERCALCQERREIKYRAGWVESENSSNTPPLTQAMHRSAKAKCLLPELLLRRELASLQSGIRLAIRKHQYKVNSLPRHDVAAHEDNETRKLFHRS